MPSSPGPQAALSLNLIEFGLTAIAVALAFAWPSIGAPAFARVERGFAALARRRTLAVCVTGATALALRLAILPFCPIPLPFVPDDFSFLLAADTFLHGRLANPTPAMWIHFESIHIDMQPTYGSMYFPAQGLALAAGKVLFGHPWFALVLLSALMCAAVCWCLQAWLPPQWALLGGMLCVLRLALFSYWTNSYHAAGSIAALGGALVLGALPRFLKRPGVGLGLLMGLGIGILGITRPYEGMLLCLPVLVAMIRWYLRSENRPPFAGLAARMAPGLLVVAAAGAWLGYYDKQAFGKATTLPYTVNRATYAIAPYYVWQSPKPEPNYHHWSLRRFYHHNELDAFNRIHSLTGFIPQTLIKFIRGVFFFTGFALLPPLVLLWRALRDLRIRFITIALAVLCAGLLIENFMLAHYLAPFTAAIYALGLQCMRHLRVARPGGKPVGMAMLRLLVLLCVVLGGLRLFDRQLHFPIHESPPTEWNATWLGPDQYGQDRANFERQLEQLPGQQLVLVRYTPDHDPLREWVYNGADIDGSKVVWAREMENADNLELFRYYRDRKVWLAEPDASPARLTPYRMPDEASSALNLPSLDQVARDNSGTGSKNP